MPVKYERKIIDQGENKTKHNMLYVPVGEWRELEKWAGLPPSISEKTKRPPKKQKGKMRFPSNKVLYFSYKVVDLSTIL